MQKETRYIYNPDGQVNKELSAIIDTVFEDDINALVKNIADHVAIQGYDRYHLLKYLENKIEFEVVSEIHNRSKLTSRIVLSEIAKGNIENCKPYQQNKTENYLKLQKEADTEIELDKIQKSKAEIAARNYICT